MARVKRGILDGFSGTVGTVVGGRWKGIEYMRSKSMNRRGKPTETQQEQQRRFSLVNKFAATMDDLFTQGYNAYADEMSTTNSATSQILKEALVGKGPDLRIDYSKVAVTKGNLRNGANPTATAGAGEVVFNWSSYKADKKSKETDQVLLVAYCEEIDICVYTVGDAIRSAGTAKLDAQPFVGKKLHTWISFISPELKKSAASIYTGELTIQ